ncbi:hypothetical protein KI811_14680 [Geobacter hydrogenophilus]|nr:hypothetical protein [Geobacter hydrogenophilus]MBT0895056.1 hypothetical protein [Geobacter hydrogenophilus]
MFAGTAIGADAPKQEKKTVVVPPSSRVLVKGATKSAGAKRLAKGVKAASAKAYGFTTGVSEEKGSFKLGILLADLETTLLAGDKDKSLKAVDTLAEGLTALGAPTPLVISVVNIKAAITGGTDLKAVSAASMPVLRPFLDDFVKKEGKTAYQKLGEWTESTRLALLASQQQKSNLAGNFLNGVNMASYFLEEMKGLNLPQGATDGLTSLAALEKTKITGAEVKAALKALAAIQETMS